MSEQCSKIMYGGDGAWGGSRCSKTGKVKVHGKWLCGIHSPEAEARRKAKADERSREWNRQWNKHVADRQYTAACVRAFHDPAGRKIATEDMAPGVVFRLRDALRQMHNWAAKFENMLENESFKDEKQFGKEHSEAWTLLSSLKVQEPGE